MAVKVQSGTTVAATVTTVTFALHYSEVQVANRGTSDLFFTVDGSTPVVGADDNYVAPANSTKVVIVPASDQAVAAPSATVVKLISTVATAFTVEGD